MQKESLFFPSSVLKTVWQSSKRTLYLEAQFRGGSNILWIFNLNIPSPLILMYNICINNLFPQISHNPLILKPNISYPENPQYGLTLSALNVPSTAFSIKLQIVLFIH